MIKKNIILTGPPRSGTTLTCNLLNRLPNVVALHEPMNLKLFPDKTEGLKNTIDFFENMRTMIDEEGFAISKVKDGVIPTNPFEEGASNRTSIVKKGKFKINKQLSPDYVLVIKHNGHFTFLLKELKNHFPCYSVIRNPVSTIASWNSINVPVSKGNLTVLKGLNPVLFEDLNTIGDLFLRQIALYNEIVKSYSLLNEKNIIRYEDLITSSGKVLSAITEVATELQVKLINKNKVNSYNFDQMEMIANKILRDQGAWRDFYTEQEILDTLKFYNQ
ncbi:sulfotransferase [Planktosalinus lacus]|uniref:Sulfotransferase n=1 Tax=Planktosalinus lacus TaxID=1526573 RepID=A0A8J2VE26_9FLAO|nr:sulfotransferase [Planktosalinus lacus]GGE00842.1 hypothetical protein GCM10011312_25320 [Planktosalinus lacus]